MPVNRDKTAKFVELANRRVNRAIKDIRLVANLSNRQNYVYTDEQARKIVKALQQEVEELKQSFFTHEQDRQQAFKL